MVDRYPPLLDSRPRLHKGRLFAGMTEIAIPYSLFPSHQLLIPSFQFHAWVEHGVRNIHE